MHFLGSGKGVGQRFWLRRPQASHSEPRRPQASQIEPRRPQASQIEPKGLQASQIEPRGGQESQIGPNYQEADFRVPQGILIWGS